MIETRKLPRMRTIPKAYKELKELDPSTDFTLGALRDMVGKGEIPTTKIRSKTLINFDVLVEKLDELWYNNKATNIP